MRSAVRLFVVSVRVGSIGAHAHMQYCDRVAIDLASHQRNDLYVIIVSHLLRESDL